MSHDYMSWTEDREPGDTRIEDYEADLLDEADLRYSVAKDEAAADALRASRETARLVPDMPEPDYYSHPALSASGAKLLLRSPALFRYRQDHPLHKPAFDLGHYVHARVLGVGAPVDVIDAPDWRSKAARDARDAAYAAGRIPMLGRDAEQGDAMARAVREWLVEAGMEQVFDPDHGQAEVSLFWRDDERGVDRRGRLDWLHEAIPGRPRLIVDLKTTVDADPRTAGRRMGSLGYHQQAAWYVDLTRAVTGADDVEFWHISVEKEAPYLVSGTRLDDDALDAGRRLNDEAIRRYLDCLAVDHWPGYPTEIVTVSLPPWELRDRGDDYA